MQLLAIKDGVFFRAQTVNGTNIVQTKEAMLKDQEGLEFQIMTDEEFEDWLMTH